MSKAISNNNRNNMNFCLYSNRTFWKGTYGSQRDRDIKTGLLDLLVYYEVPEGKRDEVKRKFEFIKNKPSSSTNAASTYIPSGSSVAA